MGPLAAVHVLRTRGLLRLFAQQARDEALPPFAAPGRQVIRARRGLGILLCGRYDGRRRRRPSGRIRRAPLLRAARAAPVKPPDREAGNVSTELHEQHQRNEKQVHQKHHASASLEPRTRRLGRDGPALTRFGLGMAALGRPGYITLGHEADLPEGRSVEAMEAHAHRVLDQAFAAGIRYFDAARSYGRAEQFLHGWIDSRGIRPAEIVIGSKWGYRYTGDWQGDGRVQEGKDHSDAMLDGQVAESTSLLGPYLRLYQIHSAAPETHVLENRQVLGRLRRLPQNVLVPGGAATR